MARFWSITLAPPILTTCLYLIIFGEIIGARVGPIDGIDYLRYIAPGLILLWTVPYSFGHSAGGFLGSRIYRYVDELLVSPMPGWLIMTAYVTSGMIRGIAVAVCVTSTFLLVSDLEVHSISLSILVLLLTSLAAAVGGFIMANLAHSFDQVTAVQLLILTPLAYLGGAFAPLDAMPVWAQNLSRANPLFYMMNAFRHGVLGVSDVPIGLALWVTAVVAILLIAVGLWMGRSRTMRAWAEQP
jgi:ABC-2 type transport system permease protein